MPISLLAATGIHFVKKSTPQKLSIINTIYKARVSAHLSLFTFTKGATTLSSMPIFM